MRAPEHAGREVGLEQVPHLGGAVGEQRELQVGALLTQHEHVVGQQVAEVLWVVARHLAAAKRVQSPAFLVMLVRSIATKLAREHGSRQACRALCSASRDVPDCRWCAIARAICGDQPSPIAPMRKLIRPSEIQTLCAAAAAVRSSVAALSRRPPFLACGQLPTVQSAPSVSSKPRPTCGDGKNACTATLAPVRLC